MMHWATSYGVSSTHYTLVLDGRPVLGYIDSSGKVPCRALAGSRVAAACGPVESGQLSRDREHARE
jgi:hypothetical protein